MYYKKTSSIERESVERYIARGWRAGEIEGEKRERESVCGRERERERGREIGENGENIDF